MKGEEMIKKNEKKKELHIIFSTSIAIKSVTSSIFEKKKRKIKNYYNQNLPPWAREKGQSLS